MGLRAFESEGLFCPYTASSHIGDSQTDSVPLLLQLTWLDSVILIHHV